ncbi:MAG: histidine phosphatase family protein [Rhodospirillales bacterium]
MKLLALRHATTGWNQAKRLQGRSDQPLAPQGLREAAGWRLPYWAADWPALTSPLRRTQQTAEAMGLTAQSAVWLNEMDWGRWEGRRLAELRRELGPRMAAQEARGLDLKPPGGESPRMVRERLAPFLADLSRQPGAGRLLVTHKGVLRALLSLATGWDLRQPWPEAFRPGHAHLFTLERRGSLSLDRLNLDLSP